ncbi:MAG: hypothetical protein AB8G77_28085 [Rhodothermales bacterium]
MANKALLFDLIQSLSRSEKRYFKLHCVQTGTATNYLKLFEAIARQSSYDEQALRAQFAGETFIKQLHVTKNYLRNLILKSLRNFHAQISKDAVLKDVLRNIEILFHKELYASCEAELKKAESLAQMYELYPGMVEIATWRRKLTQAQTPHNYQVFLKEMVDQQGTIDRLKNINQYWQLAIRISKETISRGNHPVQDDQLLQDVGNAQSLEATLLHYNACYFQHLQQNERDAAEDTLYDLIAYLEKHPARIEEDPSMYASSINNFVSFLVFQKKHQPALMLVQRAKNMYKQWKIVSERKTLFKQIMRTFNIELEIYRDTRSLEGKEAFISEIEQFVLKNRYKMPTSYLLSFWFQLANIHFIQRNFEQALLWINEILNTRYRDVRIDLQIHARMMNLMIHLEQQNLFVLRYFVDSTRRFLKKQRHIATHESVLLKFFSSIAQTPVMDYKKKFEELDRALFPDNNTPPAFSALDYIDYKQWIAEQIASS